MFCFANLWGGICNECSTILKYNCYKMVRGVTKFPYRVTGRIVVTKKGVNGDARLTHPSKKENGNGIYQKWILC